jgi:enediyne biosynthesis protein E4
VKHSGWGIGVFDFNNDGWKDLFTANSHVNDRVQETEGGVYREKNSVFVNAGGSFQEVADAGLDAVKAHRGAAFADFDGDGRIDAVVSGLGEGAELWANVSPSAGHWIALRLTGTKSNRDAIGARVRIGNQMGEVTSALGYASSASVPLHFGVGGAGVIPKIEIRWPSGRVQTLTNVKADQVVGVTEQ